MSFNKKVVLITGAGSGIGAATAIRFAELGASLALVDINADNLNEITIQCQGNPLAIVADVTNDADRIINTTILHYNQLDVLVNNAGRTALGNIENTNLEEYDRVMNLNVRSVYHLTMLAVPHLKITKGNIVNLSSVAALRASPRCLAYYISKAAIQQFTKCIALSLAPHGVRVNSVNPGTIATNILQNIGMTEAECRTHIKECKKSHPLGRPGTVDEVAKGITFLASGAASFITGSYLSIDGGMAIMS